jgi:phosphatidylserine/phosphatidylglycerophosphate/cardiolipin synthase-like enzyme
MKKIIFILIYLAYSCPVDAITIASARALAPGSLVTITGIVLNGPELGTIRYVQDGTGGIGVFSFSLSATVKGDLVTVTGITDDYFNLLEINPVNSWNLISSGNPLPQSAVITPAQLDEPVESQLVQINNVTFSNPGGSFAGNSTYGFTSSGQPGIIYLRSNSPLVGTIIPSSNVTLTGICSQNNAAYQLLPRDANDIIPSGSIAFTIPPVQANISTGGFDVSWQTNIPGSTYIEYGSTPSMGSVQSGNGGTITHTVTLSGANPSQVFYVKAYSVAGNDTAYSDIKVYMAASGSSGTIKAYFDRTVDHSVANAPSNFATQLLNTIDDTLKAYIDRCQSTLDIAIYNFDNVNTGLIIQAINDAYNRGVQVRIISDGSNNNAALPSLNAGIPKVASPQIPAGYFSIMHNKFVVMDANAANPDIPVVWTGSTNWSSDQLFVDANNVIILQDKSLAIAYTMEFNEMWGSSTSVPNASLARFGPDKTDNTPHEFLIGGKRVENYFSPSDQVNNQILRTINSADGGLFFSTFVFTRYDLAFAVENRVNGGVIAAGVVDDSSNGGGYPFSIMQSVMNSSLALYDHPSLPGILHHKYLIVDQHSAALDALVLTGSHNWSNTANLKNDENTVIVHDVNIANQYYQEFYARLTESGGSVGIAENASGKKYNWMIYPNPASGSVTIAAEATEKAAWQISITDICGKKIKSLPFEPMPGKNELKMDVSSFPAGMYFIQLQAGGSFVTKRLIIAP